MAECLYSGLAFVQAGHWSFGSFTAVLVDEISKQL